MKSLQLLRVHVAELDDLTNWLTRFAELTIIYYYYFFLQTGGAREKGHSRHEKGRHQLCTVHNSVTCFFVLFLEEMHLLARFEGGPQNNSDTVPATSSPGS